MRLTRYTDYALRVLMHLAARPSRVTPISEIARAYGISQNHLMKVVHDLGKAGYVASVRGRADGILLHCDPARVTIGEIARHTEEGFEMVDCGSCLIAPACGLTGVLAEATRAYLGVLDSYTLADMVATRGEALRLLIEGAPPPMPPPGVAIA